MHLPPETITGGHRRSSAWLPYLVLAAALSLAGLLAYFAVRTSEAEARRQFEAASEDLLSKFETRLEAYVALLRGGAALVSAQPGLNLAAFRAYVDRLRVAEFYPGVQGVGYSVRVPRGEIAALAVRLQNEGHAPFHFYPDHERSEYHAIIYLEPLDRRNQAAIGYDMFTEPVRREAMERARDGGSPAASGRVTLVQEIDEHKQPGFLIYVPVYRAGVVPDTAGERRKLLVGFVYSAFRAHDLFAGILGGKRQSLVEFAVYDGPADDPAQLLYRSPAGGSERGASTPRFQSERYVRLLGHRWTVTLNSRPELDAQVAKPLAAVVFAGGAAVSVLLFYLTLREFRARSAAERASRDLATSETALRDSEARKGAIIESAIDCIITADHEGRIVEFNPAAEAAFGYRRAEVIGKQLAETIVPPRLREKHRRGFARYLQTGEARVIGKRIEIEAMRADGSEFLVELGITVIPFKGEPIFTAHLRDITERKRLESRFRAAIESAPTAMVMIDSGGTIMLVNAQTEKFFGYAREELLGRTVEVLVPERFRAHHPDFRKAFFADPRARSMGEGRDLFGLRKDGTEFPVEIGLNPVETAEGLFVLSAIVDITERKRLDAALRHANEVLERSNLELQQFAYIAAHDLQAPLRTIGGFVQLLRHHYEAKLDGHAERWIRLTVDGVQRMHTLINDLLSYTRVDSRARPFRPNNFREVFEEAVRLLEASIRDSSAEVTCGELPTVHGDHSQLVQLLQNLIGNAIKYHGNELPRVHVDAVENGNDWLFSVRDNGIGIDPKHHETIFEIFKRLHTERIYPGTGIGLAVCRRVVHRHGGRLWVESEIGRGSVFYFTLPQDKEGSL